MYDVTNINKRYFPVKLTAEDETGETHTTVVEVGPPKIKMLRELMDIAQKASKDENEVNIIKKLRDIIKKMLSKNKSGYKVPDAYVEAMDIDELFGLLNAYFKWLAEAKNDPN